MRFTQDKFDDLSPTIGKLILHGFATPIPNCATLFRGDPVLRCTAHIILVSSSCLACGVEDLM